MEASLQQMQMKLSTLTEYVVPNQLCFDDFPSTYYLKTGIWCEESTSVLRKNASIIKVLNL